MEIGVGEAIEQVEIVIDVKCRPAPRSALHRGDPIDSSVDRCLLPNWIGELQPIQSHHHDGGIVYIGIKAILKLKGPATSDSLRVLE